MNYTGLIKSDIANGLGVRVTLFVSGCTISCPGCQNPETWDFGAGESFNEDAKNKLFELLRKPWVKGLTISGGHPLEIRNEMSVYDLVLSVKKEFPEKDIWLYTGLEIDDEWFFWDDRVSLFPRIFKCCDVIVDGPYIQDERDVSIAFRGSRNQRLIDVKKTYENHKITLLELED